MQSEDELSMRNEEYIACVQLLRDCESGKLDALNCPRCHEDAISVWFTNPKKGEYRTWFLCGKCGFQTRAQNETQPRHFCPDRIHRELEANDRAILNVARFQKPENTPQD
ncbi:MAG: hypothetical protein CMJ46_09565 [Planctomyces sp.]|nr:hypothetical protein [Planctomyces sp.]